LDEPTVGVDPVSRHEFWQILHQLAKTGTTILVSTAYMEEASQCHRVGLMHEGRLLAVNAPKALVADYLYPVYQLRAERLHDLYEQLSQSDFRDSVQLFGDRLHFTDRKHFGRSGVENAVKKIAERPLEIVQVEASLEDVFLSLIETAKGS